MRTFSLPLKAGLIVGTLVAGMGFAQAATTLTPTKVITGNTSWQDIAKASYTWEDNNHDGLVSVGEAVTFSFQMHKLYDGHHDFDALKVWFGDNSTAKAQWGDWQRILPASNARDSKVNWNKTFSFTHTFNTAATYDVVASVTCDFDLSDLTGNKNKVTPSDWDAWSTSYHETHSRQGETEFYKLTVSAVPEPESYAMLLAGLGLVGSIARRRQAKR